MDVTVEATITSKQFGLKAGEVGTVDSDAAAGHIAQGYLVILPDAPAGRRRQQAPVAEPVEPVADPPAEPTAEI